MVLYSNKLDNYAHDYLHKYKAHLGISKFESQTHTHTHTEQKEKKKKEREIMTNHSQWHLDPYSWEHLD